MNRLDEIGRRKTFAIISHPDAGKTTMTEKLLLFGGAIQTAGAVRAPRGPSRCLRFPQGRTGAWNLCEYRGHEFEYRDHAINTRTRRACRLHRGYLRC